MTLLRAVLANGRIVRLEASWGLAAIGAWGFVILLALYAYSQGHRRADGAARPRLDPHRPPPDHRGRRRGAAPPRAMSVAVVVPDASAEGNRRIPNKQRYSSDRGEGED